MSHYLCKIAEIGEYGKEVRVILDSKVNYIMLFSHAGSIHAFLNVCPHEGRPLNVAPDRFLFSAEHRLVCGHHGACFELDTGECVDGPCRGKRLKSVQISVKEGSVWLDNHSSH